MPEPRRLAREHLHGFLRALEDAGVAVAPPKKADFLVSLVASPPADVDALYWRARVTLVGRPEDFEVFDAVFAAFFRGGRWLVHEVEGAAARGGRRDRRAAGAAGTAPLDALEPRQGSGLAREPARPRGRVQLRARDPGGARVAARAGAASLADVLPQVAARRMRRGRGAGRGSTCAACSRRRTARAARSSRSPGGGGRARPRRVLVLIDVSGSLQAVQPGPAAVRPRARARDRPRRGVHVRDAAHARDARARRARRRHARSTALSACVLDADGGTRIGVALYQFLANGRYVALARGALVIVLSDGLERGDPALMAASARRLARLAHRLVWWSPLACDPAYRPVTRGMQAILGDLDVLAGARDLPSLLAEVRRLPEASARPRRTAIRAWSTT